jgi:hypothetical protein
MDILVGVISTYNIDISFTDADNLFSAAEFIHCFTAMAAFLGVAVIALQRPPSESLKKNQRDHGENRASDSVPC